MSDDDVAAATDDDGARTNDRAAQHAPATGDARAIDHCAQHTVADHHTSSAAFEQPPADAARDCPTAA